MSDHVGDSLGGEEYNGHAVPVEAGENVPVRFDGDGADVRLEVGRVAHDFVEGGVSWVFGKGFLCVDCYP